MDKLFKLPPKSAADLTPPVQLSLNLSGLIGQEFHVTGKPRTDGSNVRKRIAQTLQSFQLPEAADINSYVIVPPKGKGVPRNVREFVDSYIVTTGDSYNLQVWNRIPDSESLLIDYESSSPLKCSDVRFVFVKINIEESLIESVIILTADYIVSHFGKFGKQTVKHQLLISPKARKAIYELGDRILTFPDSAKLKYLVKDEFTPPASDIAQEPDLNNLYSINQLKERIAKPLIGRKLESTDTKNRGQALERLVIELLGYEPMEDQLLEGGFPDIRNQLLEVKVQDSPTVDLGRFTPENEMVLYGDSGMTTFDVRYLIALTNPESEIIEGIILAPGQRLGDLFSYVSDESYKCQRSIPMTFFNNYRGSSIFNPD